ncbi:hypothetical protein [Candidatus Hadarchaeum sp.]|uniref:hypothetical protein n=1 Tax=Candidatus Hadarchaeum sp. TaxID=2883567 RepID=UPI003D129033
MAAGVAASDIIRAMLRAGYPTNEIYDLLVEAGLKGEQVQLLIERVALEFGQANMEPRPSRTVAELSRFFLDPFNNFAQEIRSQVELFSLKQEMMGKEIENLKQLLVVLLRRFEAKKSEKKEF